MLKPVMLCLLCVAMSGPLGAIAYIALALMGY